MCAFPVLPKKISGKESEIKERTSVILTGIIFRRVDPMHGYSIGSIDGSIDDSIAWTERENAQKLILAMPGYIPYDNMPRAQNNSCQANTAGVSNNK